jgi:hypothetical protein
MSKRRPKKTGPHDTPADSTAGLGKALAKRSKKELLDVLLELAREDRGVLRRLTAQFDVAAAPKQLMAATRHAIADATEFDEREINRNFSYNYEAYGEVKRNLSRLIDLKQLQSAMELALQLMREGSYQVEMSDEGLMTQDIEDCLRVDIKSLKKCDLPADEVIAWCSEMFASDRVGFICQEELQALRDHFKASGAK